MTAALELVGVAVVVPAGGIELALAAAYAEVVAEPVPADMAALLAALDAARPA